MDNRTSQVTVADEINYIRNYLDIYKRRFIGQFEHKLDIPDEMMACQVQKMILQPLVENCLKHGFENMKSGGCIEIRGRKEGEDCIFEVVDNGKGISSEKTEELRRELGQADERLVDGIGLFNVHQRIIIEHGPQYGIREIDSKEGEYTRIVLKT